MDYHASRHRDTGSDNVKIKRVKSCMPGCLTTILILGLVAGNFRQCQRNKTLSEENDSLKEKIELLEGHKKSPLNVNTSEVEPVSPAR